MTQPNEHRHLRLDESRVVVEQRPPKVRVRSVVEIEFRRGEGCCADDVVRTCTAYYSVEDAQLLALVDPSPTTETVNLTALEDRLCSVLEHVLIRFGVPTHGLPLAASDDPSTMLARGLADRGDMSSDLARAALDEIKATLPLYRVVGS